MRLSTKAVRLPVVVDGASFNSAFLGSLVLTGMATKIMAKATTISDAAAANYKTAK